MISWFNTRQQERDSFSELIEVNATVFGMICHLNDVPEASDFYNIILKSVVEITTLASMCSVFCCTAIKTGPKALDSNALLARASVSDGDIKNEYALR